MVPQNTKIQVDYKGVCCFFACLKACRVASQPFNWNTLAFVLVLSSNIIFAPACPIICAFCAICQKGSFSLCFCVRKAIDSQCNFSFLFYTSCSFCQKCPGMPYLFQHSRGGVATFMATNTLNKKPFRLTTSFDFSYTQFEENLVSNF